MTALPYVSLDQGNLLLTVLGFGVLVLKVWALVDCASRPAGVFVSSEKLTKPIWLAILAVSLLVALHFGLLGLFGIAGTVASVVYLVDVRPAVSGTPDRW